VAPLTGSGDSAVMIDRSTTCGCAPHRGQGLLRVTGAPLGNLQSAGRALMAASVFAPCEQPPSATDHTNTRIDVSAVAEATGLSIEDVQAAEQNLERDGLVVTRGAMGHPVLYFANVSGEPLRKAGNRPRAISHS
jgi:hypothetical protein